MHKSFVIILLATLALTLMVPAVSGISLLQQAIAARSGQNGIQGINSCTPPSACHVEGGKGGTGNVANIDDSFNGNGGDGGRARSPPTNTIKGLAQGGPGGSGNSHNQDLSTNGDGGRGGFITCTSACFVQGSPGGSNNSHNSDNSKNGNGGMVAKFSIVRPDLSHHAAPLAEVPAVQIIRSTPVIQITVTEVKVARLIQIVLLGNA